MNLDRLPPRLGDHRLEEVVGEGTGTTIVRALTPVGHSALKIGSRGDRTVVRRLQFEAQVYRRVGPVDGLVPFLELGASDEWLWIALAFADGSDLTRTMPSARTPTEVMAALREIVRIARALGALHRRGVVHGDVKPENMLRAKGRLHLADLGSAWIRGRCFETPTATPSYAAPEQLRGGRARPAVDVWALGVVVFELAAGALPWTHDSADGILVEHLTGPIPQLGSGSEFGDALDPILRRALAKAPGDRFVDGSAFAEALAAALR